MLIGVSPGLSGVGAGKANNPWSVADTAGNAWHSALGPVGTSRPYMSILFSSNIAAGSTTVTLTALGTTDLRIVVIEYAGILTASPLDGTSASGSTSTSGTYDSGAITPTLGYNDLIIRRDFR